MDLLCLVFLGPGEPACFHWELYLLVSGFSSRSSFHCITFFPSLKLNFIAYSSSSCPDCIFEINQLWQSGFSRMYFNSCCSCSFEPEIIKISQLSHKMSRNNIVNFQESTTILNACIKKSENLLKAPRNMCLLCCWILFSVAFHFQLYFCFFITLHPVFLQDLR